MSPMPNFTDSDLIQLLREHGYEYVIRRYRPPAQRLMQLALTHKVGNLPQWRYPDWLRYQVETQKRTFMSIAKQFGVNHSVVSKHARRYDIKSPNREYSKDDDNTIIFDLGTYSRSAVAAKIGRDPSSIRYRAQKLGLTQARAIGYTALQLAQDLGVQRGLVATWIDEFGLPSIRMPDMNTIGIDEVGFYDWLERGHILRIAPEIIEKRPWLREVRDRVMITYVTRAELNQIMLDEKSAHTIGFPKALMNFRRGIGNLYVRAEMAEYFQTHRHRLKKLHEIPLHLTFWREWIQEWDSTYIMIRDIMPYFDFVKGPTFFNREYRNGHLPKRHGTTCQFFKRSELLEVLKNTTRHKRLKAYMEKYG